MKLHILPDTNDYAEYVICDENSGIVAKAETEEIATLLAAAPEMLEALTTIVENASKANVPGEYYLHQLALDAAKIAIQKAINA